MAAWVQRLSDIVLSPTQNICQSVLKTLFTAELQMRVVKILLSHLTLRRNQSVGSAQGEKVDPVRNFRHAAATEDLVQTLLKMTSGEISDAHLSLQTSLCRKMQARETRLVSALISATLGLKPLLPVCFFFCITSDQSPISLFSMCFSTVSRRICSRHRGEIAST